MSYSRSAVDLIGQRFGFLTALHRNGRRARAGGGAFSLWLCRCDCGREITARGDKLRSGRKKACGIAGHLFKPTKGKGLAALHRAEYQSFLSMWKRCTGKHPKHVHNYKARGVKVCARWKSFKAFLEDMGKKPTLKHTIDRYPNNAGNYEPSNCRWATTKEQNRNKRNSVVVEYEGEKMLLIDVVDKVGLSRSVVYGRIKNGWTLADAISVPVHRKKSK